MTASWVRSDVTLGDDPRTRKLARRLDVSIPTAVGHLHLLWHWAKSFAEDGDLSQHDAEDVAIGARWDGDPDAFLDALTAAGFIDGGDDERACISGFDVISGAALSKARSEAGRKGAQVRWHGDGNAISEPLQGHNLPVAKNATGRDATGRDATGRDGPDATDQIAPIPSENHPPHEVRGHDVDRLASRLTACCSSNGDKRVVRADARRIVARALSVLAPEPVERIVEWAEKLDETPDHPAVIWSAIRKKAAEIGVADRLLADWRARPGKASGESPPWEEP